jgi:hypothetical protein
MSSKPKKPSKIIIEPIRARAIRGPHKKNPKSWYWRPEYHHAGTTENLGCFWATRQEARERITEVARGQGHRPAGGGAPGRPR